MKTLARPLALLSALILLALCSTSAFAATIVDWGGSYVPSSFVNLNMTGNGTTGNTYTRYYSASTKLSPTSGYTAPSGKSGNFYGALETTQPSAVPTTLGQYRVQDNVAGDRIQLTGGSGVGTNTLLGFITFLRTDFLNGTSTGPALSFDASSSLVLNIPAGTNATAVRMAVLNGSTW